MFGQSPILVIWLKDEPLILVAASAAVAVVTPPIANTATRSNEADSLFIRESFVYKGKREAPNPAQFNQYTKQIEKTKRLER